MEKISKGALSRIRVLTQAREVMNVHGSHITLRQLAELMEVKVSAITNHFPTREQLFVEISRDYDVQFNALIKDTRWQQPLTLHLMAEQYSAIMDLQYAYRSAILGITQAIGKENALMKQVLSSYRENRKGVRSFMEQMVKQDILDPCILQPELFQTVQFQLVNLFTTWLLSLSLYDSRAGYRKMKPLYLKGILYLLKPYLTPAALHSLPGIDFDAVARKRPLRTSLPASKN
jgi:AcrR family transcriptional regulator